MKAESPTPRIDSASPEATWFATSVIATKANTSASAAPAAKPASAPIAALPE